MCLCMTHAVKNRRAHTYYCSKSLADVPLALITLCLLPLLKKKRKHEDGMRRLQRKERGAFPDPVCDSRNGTQAIFVSVCVCGLRENLVGASWDIEKKIAGKTHF